MGAIHPRTPAAPGGDRRFTPRFDIDLPASLREGADPVEALRTLADFPASLRAQGLRMMANLCSGRTTGDPDLRASCDATFERAAAGYATALALFDGRDLAGLHPEVRAVIEEVHAPRPAFFEVMRTMARRMDGCRAAWAVGAPPPQPQFDELVAYANGAGVEAITAFTEALRAAAERRRSEATARMKAAQGEAMEGRRRIADIARTVRLISLNARVEAARAGEAGRAFGVIAEEIKALSEQTEAASRALETSIAAIASNARTI